MRYRSLHFWGGGVLETLKENTVPLVVLHFQEMEATATHSGVQNLTKRCRWALTTAPHNPAHPSTSAYFCDAFTGGGWQDEDILSCSAAWLPIKSKLKACTPCFRRCRGWYCVPWSALDFWGSIPLQSTLNYGTSQLGFNSIWICKPCFCSFSS